MTPVRVAIVVAGLALGVVAYEVQMDNIMGTTSLRSLASPVYSWAFLAAGLAAWSRRPGNRLGPLMVLVGFAMLLRQLRYSHDSLAFTTFYLVGELPYAVFAHAVLAYPAGVVLDRLERAFVRVTYVIVLVFPFAILLFYDGSRPLRYFDPTRRESLLLVSGSADAVSALQQVYAVVAYGVLAAAFVALIGRRLQRATPRARRLLAPLLVVAAVTALRAVFDSVLTFSTRPPAIVYDNLFWWYVAGLVATPLALLAGLLRSRLAHGTVADLVVQLQHTPPSGIRDRLSAALDDPSLEVLLWLPERDEYVDAGGSPARLPETGGPRAVTRLDDDEGAPLAALLHDPSLRDEPELVAAAGAAARLALVNARLHAEVQAQLEEVKESRARIVAAGDVERRRIERDLHDGAQVRLVALALELKRAQRGVHDPAVERLLETTAAELQGAVQELRDLAHGLHPPVLVQNGLAVALGALADGAPLPVTVDAESGRFDPEVEATAYFVAAEALANVAKHAGASRARVAARRDDGRLVVCVEDDGAGGARVDAGSGLRGLQDRLQARGGRLVVDSPPGGGTRLSAEIPLP